MQYALMAVWSEASSLGWHLSLCSSRLFWPAGHWKVVQELSIQSGRVALTKHGKPWGWRSV